MVRAVALRSTCDEAVGHGIKEGLELDMIIRRDAGQTPFGKLVIIQWKTGQSRALDGLEELSATDAQPAHDVVVDAIERLGNSGIGLSQREESLVAQAPQNAGLGETHSILHFRFIPRLSWPCWKNTDAIVGSHHAVAAVDLGIVETGATDARLQIVGNDESGNAVKKTKHPDMRADPVGERLRPGGLGKGVTGRTQHRHEDLRLADLTGLAIDNRNLLAGIIHEDLVAGRMLLAHRR